ncbi:helix-turn-helix domain-containing protein [Halalkalicoccus salilacus]|uniref:helix-turn-helix domain-containing protein n=1 Tax=Halalkalicoccus salilacus TaxID=3117459 RepID=UPI00390828B2
MALRQLGTGSARDIARIADVPRPRVYVTVEALEERAWSMSSGQIRSPTDQ